MSVKAQRDVNGMCLHTPYRLSSGLSITFWSSITKQSKLRYRNVSCRNEC